MPDELKNFDVIVGPVANDTIYDTRGIMTSGYLSDEEAMELLCIGPCYRQITLKNQKAADNLRFITSNVLTGEEIDSGKRRVAQGEEQYLLEFARVMEGFDS